ncbi:MAG: exosortase-associated protein EpsI, B-type [Burkholderiaceae bacterium]
MSPVRRRALVLAASMGAAAALAALGKPASHDDTGAPPVDLDTLLPREFGDWRVDASTEAFVRPAAQQGKAYKIYDQVFERTFVNSNGQRIMVSAAFGRKQSASMQMHRPEVCYPSGGFKVEGLEPVQLTLAGQAVAATRLHAFLPGRSEPITYWTLLGDVVVADSTAFRLRQISFGMRRQLLDGLLMRVSSIDAEPARAYALQSRFADELVRAMRPAERVKVIGVGAAS